MRENIKEEISKNLDENVSYLKFILKDASDIVFREFHIGDFKTELIYIDGMANRDLINDFILKSFMYKGDSVKNTNEIKNNILTVSDLIEVESMRKGIDSMLSGDTLLFLQGFPKCYVVATRLWPARGVAEPSGETAIRGGRDGFTETIRFNTALIRRRIRDTRLKIVSQNLGVRSKTDVVVVYIEDIVNKEVLKELNSRLEKINIDAILDSGYVEHLIEDSSTSLFPQIQSTERPDVVAASLYEGRIAILVDNSPFVIIVPAILPNFFQSPDDYYQRWMYSSTVRIVRVISLFITLILPASYVAVTSFHSSIIPTKLAYFIAASREGVPFPAYVETIIMEISLAFLMESIVRLPKPISSTVGIVGGLIIGQAAVSAGIASPIMIIIVSVTAITSFTVPNYDIASAFRIIRFFLIILSSFLGLYGIVLGLIIVLVHLSKLKSFGVPYLSPIVSLHTKDFKDMFIRLPIKYFKERPNYMKTEDKIRQK